MNERKPFDGCAKPNANGIEAYIHCGKCLAEMPAGESPKSWSRTQAGWTAYGLQVWCNRHDVNVMHIDFLGNKFPADTTAPVRP